MKFLEDQSQPLPSPLSVDGVNVVSAAFLYVAGDDREALRRRRAGINYAGV